jgi:allantoinase
MKLRETGDFLQAWGGISSLQFRLPAMWTEAQRRVCSIEDLAEWLCAAPAKLVGLNARKGRIAIGCDADIVLWSPEQHLRVEPEMIHHRHKLTPYEDQVFQGVVKTTFLRGEKVYDGDEFAATPRGHLLKQSIATVSGF